uniref:Uncharacterized protein n=1 Tax=Romanomermis culicivorax TaxID=13658 RepID=A0A915J0F7_ROMCU
MTLSGRSKTSENQLVAQIFFTLTRIRTYREAPSETPSTGVFDPSNLSGQQFNVTNCAQFYASYPPPAIAFPAPPGRPYFFYPAPGTNMANWSSSSYDNAHESSQKQETPSYNNNNNYDYDSIKYQLEQKRE